MRASSGCSWDAAVRVVRGRTALVRGHRPARNPHPAVRPCTVRLHPTSSSRRACLRTSVRTGAIQVQPREACSGRQRGTWNHTQYGRPGTPTGPVHSSTTSSGGPSQAPGRRGCCQGRPPRTACSTIAVSSPPRPLRGWLAGLATAGGRSCVPSHSTGRLPLSRGHGAFAAGKIKLVHQEMRNRICEF